MKSAFAAALCAVLFAGAMAYPFPQIDTVADLQVAQYLGRWYQVYASPAIVNTFEKDAVCITADYSTRDDGKVGVFNANRVNTVDGEVKNITGYAYIPDASQPGQLKVRLQGGAPFDAPYWVAALGPVVNGQYVYSIVTDPYTVGLFVLVRDVAAFQATYAKEIEEKLSTLGFTHFWNKPIPTTQEGCTYPW
eukprot:Opistho-2@57302